MARRITERVLEEIKARVDIVELIGARVELKKSGASFKGCCPFHHEKTPSFHVTPGKQFYHCFGCGESGDIFKFLMRQDGLTFQDAVRTLAERCGVVIEEEADSTASSGRNLLYALHANLAAFYQRCLEQTAAAETARAYLAQRSIPELVVKQFGIGYAPAQPRDALLRWAAKHGYSAQRMVEAGVLALSERQGRNDHYDRFRGRLIFPIRDQRGRVVAFSARILDPAAHPAKYVNSPETEIFTKGRTLYALDMAAASIVKHPRREALVCEGQIDVIRCHACGFENTVAAQGTAFTREHVTLLKRYADSVILMFDGDSAGRKAALRTGALFLEEQMPVRVASLPTGADPDSFLRDSGAAKFREILEDAASITAFQIETMRLDEERPDTIDAVNRVGRAVLEMLAGCPGALLRTRLLQEAAELLNISYSALESDLTQVVEGRRQRAAYAAPPAGMTPGAAPTLSPEVGSESPQELHDGAPQAVAPPIPPPRGELLLCEFMIEHEQEPEVLELAERHLPLELFTHSFTQAVVAALLRQHRDGSDQLAELHRTAPPAWHRLLDNLLAHPQKMLGARDITRGQAARELIRSLWVQRLKDARGRLPEESTPENDSLRFPLTTLIKQFETYPWERIAARLNVAAAAALRPEGDLRLLWASDAPGAAGAHAADSASATADPEEFPPSEYPPDETPD